MDKESVISKKNVIIFTGGLMAGGAEKQSILLAKGLKDKYNVILISYFGNSYLARNTDFLNNEKITYYQLTGNVFKKISNLFVYINKIRPYAIINFLPSNNFFGGALGKLLGVKRVIGSIRTAKLDSQRKYAMLLVSHLFFNNTTVFNSVAGLKHYNGKGFRGKKSTVIQNCLYPQPVSFISRKGTTEIIILIVARFEEYKDYSTALESFHKVKKMCPEKNIKLQIVGVGPCEKMIINWIKTHDLEQDITVTVNPENINDYYLKAKIFLQTSLVEGFSNSIMEAMSFSLPIIATDVGDNSQMVINAENGYIVPVKRPDIIGNQLKVLIESEELRNEMGLKSYEIASKNYSLIEFANRFMNVIER